MTVEVSVKILKKVNGRRINREYKGFQSIQIANSIFTLGKSFRISYFENPNEGLKFNRGDLIEISFDNKPVLKGYIENFERSVDIGSKTYTQIATGGDIFSQTQHSQLETSPTQAPNTIKTMISNVFDELGYKNYTIEIDEEEAQIQSTQQKKKKKVDFLAGEVGMKAWDYISNIASKSFLLISSNGLDKVVMTRGYKAKRYKTPLRLNRDGRDSNIIRASLDTNGTLPYANITLLTGGDGAKTAGTKNSNNFKGVYKGTNAIPYRKKVVLLNFPINSNVECDELAEWYGKSFIKLSNALNVDIPGVYLNGDIIEVNRLVRVECDYILDKPDFFLISQVEHMIDYSGGSPNITTSLSLIDKQGVEIEDINELAGINFI